MDMTTEYMGLRLAHPFMAGASPMTGNLDGVRQLEDAGAAAIVLPSVFEEQIRQEQYGTTMALELHNDQFGEALSYLPEPPDLPLGPELYLDHVAAVKKAVALPVIGSINGVTETGWTDFAKLIEDAGADALELNIYFIATDPDETGGTIEERTVSILRRVKDVVSIPVAVKLPPFFSSVPNIARRLDQAGADGLILFNRFFQPDYDIDELELVSRLNLEHRSDLALRLAWTGLLSGQVDASLALNGGVHSATDAIKAVMAGAQAIQMVSALLMDGPTHLTRIRDQVLTFMAEREYDSLEEMRGSMSVSKVPNPQAYQRAAYIKLLESWR